MWILYLIARDALLPIYRIKRKSISGLRIFVVIGGFSLLANALLLGSSVYSYHVTVYKSLYPHADFAKSQMVLDNDIGLYMDICLDRASMSIGSRTADGPCNPNQLSVFLAFLGCGPVGSNDQSYYHIWGHAVFLLSSTSLS